MRLRSQRKTTRVLDPPVFCVHPCIAESVVPFRYPWTPKRWMKEWNNNVMGLLKGIVWWRVWGVWECPESIEMNGIGWIIILSGTLAILCCLRSTLWSVSSNTSNSCEKTNTRKMHVSQSIQWVPRHFTSTDKLIPHSLRTRIRRSAMSELTGVTRRASKLGLISTIANTSIHFIVSNS